MSILEIDILQPNDFHHHFRDGDALKDTVRIASDSFRYVVAMPNLVPPVVTVNDATDYSQRIAECIPLTSNMEVLMTIYLTDATTADQIVEAKASGIVFGDDQFAIGRDLYREYCACIGGDGKCGAALARARRSHGSEC